MRATLPPVLDKAAYAESIAPEIAAWFLDVVFEPVFDELREAGVELQHDKQNISNDQAGRRRLAKDERANAAVSAPTPFPPQMGSLNIPRSAMPQIPGSARGALVRFLEARGATSREAWLLPGALRPTQAGYWPEKVERAEPSEGDRAILISREGRILDGHHQWLAAIWNRPEEPIRAIRFSRPIGDLLELARTFPSSERANAAGSEAIRAALLSGRIWYADGAFGSDGPYGAELVRELRALGARFEALTKLYVIAANEIPFELRGAIDSAQEAAVDAHRSIIEKLTLAGENVPIAPTGLRLVRPVGQIIMDLEAQFQRPVARAVQAVSVAPKLPQDLRDRLTKRLTENVELSIKNFAAEEIPELRRMVEANLMQGGRLDRLSAMIEARWGVAQRKAAFWARQETGLLTATFREERAKSAGSTRYVWRTMRDPRVRDDHADLEGKTFFWDHPPLVDHGHGRHANPGEDYGCRCWAEPIVDLPKLAAQAA